MGELKPCPFCGGEAEVVESDYGMYLTGYAVYCHKCCLKMGVTGRLGEAYEWTPVFNTEAEAIDVWNARAERTCKFVSIEGTGYTPVCSACGYKLGIYDCDWFEDGTYGYGGNYCPCCGAKVVDE